MHWFKTTLVTATLASTFLLSGCGEDNSNQECVYEVQMSLDKGDYDTTIELLENDGTCGGEFTQEEGLQNLGAAYIGAAGFDLDGLIQFATDVDISEILELDLDALSDPAALADVTDLLDSMATALNNLFSNVPKLDDAAETYKEIIALPGNSCDNETQSSALTVACALQDFNSTQIQEILDMLTSVTGLTGGLGDDLDIFLSAASFDSNASHPNRDNVNDNEDADEFEVFTCSFAEGDNNSSIDGNCSEPTITYVNKETVIFTKAGLDFNYLVNEFEVNDTNANDGGNAKYIRLIDLNSLILAAPATVDGNCTAPSMLECSEVSLTATPKCYPCPVISDEGNTSTSSDALLDLVNDEESPLVAELGIDLSEYENTDSNSTPLTQYIRAQSDSNETSDELTAEEIADFLAIINE